MIAVDLFAGLGGLTEGARQAGVAVRWAANHWREAVRWHTANHPEVVHACQDLQQADFRDAPPHDLLLAAPACQGHSRARGKERPHHDAMRATAWAVVTCAEVHRPPVAVVENVPEFLDWVLWPAWSAAMQALGYALAPLVLDAADFGVPQHRKRLVLVATRSRAPIELQLERQAPVPAASVVDFDAGTWSRVADKVPNTRARIAAGRRRFGDRFLAPYYGSGSGKTGRSLARPIGTIPTRARWALVDGDMVRMVSVPEGRAFMGFDAAYQLPESVALAWHLLGNAAPPPMVRRVVEAIRRAA